VINAGDYNMPQRRKRIFILCYHKGTKIYQNISSDSSAWLTEKGILAKSFKSNEYSKVGTKAYFTLDYSKEYIKSRLSLSHSDKSDSNYFSNYMADKKIQSLFQNSGVMINGKIITAKHLAKQQNNNSPLKKFLEKDESLIKEEFIISEKEYLEKWKPTKDSKKIIRKSEDQSFEYEWSEGKMPPFDDLNKPARTIITSEGGRSASRTKHIIQFNGAYRRLLPSELDQLNMFPKDFTKFGLDKDGGQKIIIPNTKRAFLMGNALVVGVIEQIGKRLHNSI
jgi:DNA (cytosine-5)-methyltransferase 1